MGRRAISISIGVVLLLAAAGGWWGWQQWHRARQATKPESNEGEGGHGPVQANAPVKISPQARQNF